MTITLLGVLCVPAQRIQNFVGGHSENTFDRRQDEISLAEIERITI
ncbi:MAG: hypothetical protein WAK31_26810 [Chthoniobacterales bacterium]